MLSGMRLFQLSSKLPTGTKGVQHHSPKSGLQFPRPACASIMRDQETWQGDLVKPMFVNRMCFGLNFGF